MPPKPAPKPAPSTAVATVSHPLPPALANTPALDLDRGDVQLPRVKIAHTSSVAFQDGNVAFGDLYAAAGKEDPDPVILRPAKADATEPGVLFHILGGPRKGWAGKDESGAFKTWAFGDQSRPDNALQTWDYPVCLPEIDPDLPYRWLMSSSASGPAAKQINMLLIKNQPNAPYALAFRATTKFRENPKGKFYSLVVKQVEATPEGIEAAESLAILVASQPEPSPAAAAASSAPAI